MNVLCVMAHPDDEVLGAGGTLAKHAEAGDTVDIRLLSFRPETSEGATKARQVLGAASSHQWGGLKDQMFDVQPLLALVRHVEAFDLDPDVIYTHHPGDLNLDHALTAKAVLTAFRPKPGERPRSILACEVLSSTEWTFPQVFQPNYFVALSSEQLEKKIAALRCYPSEVEEWPHPRSPDGLDLHAAARGQQTGVERAEAFQVLRIGPL